MQADLWGFCPIFGSVNVYVCNSAIRGYLMDFSIFAVICTPKWLF